MSPTSPQYPLSSMDFNFSMYSCNDCADDIDANSNDDDDDNDDDNDDNNDDDDDNDDGNDDDDDDAGLKLECTAAIGPVYWHETTETSRVTDRQPDYTSWISSGQHSLEIFFIFYVTNIS